MSPTLLLHVVAGAIGLLSGYVAIFSRKGARVHRASGLVFVVSMVLMGVSGALIAALTGVEISVIAGLTAAYLVVTALTAVRPRTRAVRRVDAAAMIAGLAIGLPAVSMGIATLTSPTGLRDGMPAYPFFVIGLPALLGSAGDLRLLLAGRLTGAPRVSRHLWRMTYALLIAAISFFFGQADELPEALRHPALLAAPVLAVLLSLAYWLWRVRIRRALRGLLAHAHWTAAPSS